MIEFGNCEQCGKSLRWEELDAKPDDPENPDTCEWSKFYCQPCYGDGFNEM